MSYEEIRSAALALPQSQRRKLATSLEAAINESLRDERWRYVRATANKLAAVIARELPIEGATKEMIFGDSREICLVWARVMIAKVLVEKYGSSVNMAAKATGRSESNTLLGLRKLQDIIDNPRIDPMTYVMWHDFAKAVRYDVRTLQ